MTEIRLQRVFDRARWALDDNEPPARERRRPGLDPHDFPTRRAALADLPSTLVHRSTRRRGLPDLVDPFLLTRLEQMQAVGRELARGGALELVRRAREHGACRRARVLGLPTEERDPES